MFFLRAIIVVLATVTSIQFFISEAQLVRRAERVVQISWRPNVPVIDLPQYTLGFCRYGTDRSCFTTNTVVQSYTAQTELVINNVFRENGFYRFCVFLPDSPASEVTALYLGPIFSLFD